MIRFDQLTKSFRVRGDLKVVLDQIDLELPSGKAVGLLGRNGAGKSTLLQIVAGTMRADSGRVVTDGSLSWPVGFGGSFHGELTGAQNVRFLARIYGVDTEGLQAFVEDFAELGKHFHMPVRSYSQGMRSRLTFGASMGIPFDTYLVDEVTAVGDVAFKRKSNAVFRERMKTAGAIMVSHSTHELRQYCDAGAVLIEGKLYYFEDLEEAISLHNEVMK